MLKWIGTGLLSLALLVAAVPSTPPIAVQHLAAHRITLKTPEGADDGFCSSIAVSPRMLLTAEHCFEGGAQLGSMTKGIALVTLMDGTQVSPDEIAAILHDGSDHVLVVFKQPRFKQWLPIMERQLQPAERIHYFGNPKGFTDQYREGYVMGYSLGDDPDFPDKQLVVMDVNGWYGDSGSGILDAAGNVVAVVSIAYVDREFKVMVSIPLAFTPAQLNGNVAATNP